MLYNIYINTSTTRLYAVHDLGLGVIINMMKMRGALGQGLYLSLVYTLL